MDILKIVIDHLLTLLVTIITPILLYFIHRGLKYLEEKYKFNLTQEQQQKLDELIEKAIHYAEEQAHKALKLGSSIESNKKLESALTFLTEEMKRNNLPEIAASHLTKLIEARLFEQREG